MRYIYGNPPLYWMSKEHQSTYEHEIRVLEGYEGPFTRLNIYLLTATETTREHLWDILDFRVPHSVIPGSWNEPWNTPESRFLIGLVSLLNDDDFFDHAAADTLVYPVLLAQEWSAELLDAMRPPAGES